MPQYKEGDQVRYKPVGGKHAPCRPILVLTSGDQKRQKDYEHVIATSNLLFRFSRPECAVQPGNTAQVQDVIREARKLGLKVTIKCNGHSYAGYSTAHEFISLDLRRMTKVSLDMGKSLATVDAGCQWGHVHGSLINGRHNGDIVVGAAAQRWGRRRVMTADGEVVTVEKDDDSMSGNSRLFWGLRGAGACKFGVAVEMKLKAQKLANKNGKVVAGRKMTIGSTWTCDLRQPEATQRGVRFTLTFDGSEREYHKWINDSTKHMKLKRQLKRRALEEQLTRFWYEMLVAQWLEETERVYPSDKTYELYSSFVFTNGSKDKFHKITSTIRRLMERFRFRFKEEQVNFLITWTHTGGRATDIMEPSESAYFWREAVYHTYVTIEWVDKWMEGDMEPSCARRVKKMWDKDDFSSGIRVWSCRDEVRVATRNLNEEDEEDKTDRLASEQGKHFRTNNWNTQRGHSGS
ncbi:FAD-binding domain-containing protein [Parathielavia appendiculata]|uniref:FAD-binding domain-containing protein n=1 Tax=Parathielavia appendiculata TaxID=2587402 RepID=A0AAN6U388_9PEZI|nr:FAD-binding domain-containing protein [Parathielavia appendiculata]